MDVAFELSPVFWALVPVTVALVSLAKHYIDSYWAPLLSLGIGYVLAQVVTDLSLLETVVPGLVVGLSSAGVYSSAKAMLK